MTLQNGSTDGRHTRPVARVCQTPYGERHTGPAGVVRTRRTSGLNIGGTGSRRIDSDPDAATPSPAGAAHEQVCPLVCMGVAAARRWLAVALARVV
jgi:hypothetical protein